MAIALAYGIASLLNSAAANASSGDAQLESRQALRDDLAALVTSAVSANVPNLGVIQARLCLRSFLLSAAPPALP